VFEFDINWDEHSGACEDVHVFGFIGSSYFSIQYICPEKWCGEKGFNQGIPCVMKVDGDRLIGLWAEA
jgi:hypothetical protein